MGCQLPNCAESCLELVTTGLSLEGKTSGLRTKMAHAHVHNRRDEKGDDHRVYDPLPRGVLSKPGREGMPRAWILAWESVVHTLQTDQMPRPARVQRRLSDLAAAARSNMRTIHTPHRDNPSCL